MPTSEEPHTWTREPQPAQPDPETEEPNRGHEKQHRNLRNTHGTAHGERPTTATRNTQRGEREEAQTRKRTEPHARPAIHETTHCEGRAKMGSTEHNQGEFQQPRRTASGDLASDEAKSTSKGTQSEAGSHRGRYPPPNAKSPTAETSRSPNPCQHQMSLTLKAANHSPRNQTLGREKPNRGHEKQHRKLQDTHGTAHGERRATAHSTPRGEREGIRPRKRTEPHTGPTIRDTTHCKRRAKVGRTEHFWERSHTDRRTASGFIASD